MTFLKRAMLLWHRMRLRARRMIRGSEPLRYRHLTGIIDRNRCRRILEIGTWNGKHALEMIQAASRHWPVAKIEYYGFDLFEEIDDTKIAQEISKRPPPIAEVQALLSDTGAKIRLFQGDSVRTLPAAVRGLPSMDFVFIDGGHSYETVASDWAAVQELLHSTTVVIFDDYWGQPESGIDRVVGKIDRTRYNVEILEPEDQFVKEWGLLRVRFVQVTLRVGTPTSS